MEPAPELVGGGAVDEESGALCSDALSMFVRDSNGDGGLVIR